MTGLSDLAPGVQIDNWTILESRRKMNSRIRCQCKCGAIREIIAYNLLRGRSTQCASCVRKASHKPKYGPAIRGSDFERLYGIWMKMKDTCTSTIRETSHLYSLRGISVCHEWQNDFAAFRDWSLANGYRDDLTIDRWPDQNGNYEPGNCRWATWEQQARNTRSNRLLTAFGETKTLIEWTEDIRCVVTRDALRFRLDRHWLVEAAICTPYDAAKEAFRLKTKGSRNGNSQLTEEMVRSIRSQCADGSLSQGKIAAQFGIAQCTVSAIHLRKLWGWLP